MSTAQVQETIPLACRLTDPDQIRRRNELHQTLFKKVSQVIGHPNSYELLFQEPDGKLNGEIFAFIQFERICCPWLNFRVNIQPGEGPITLEMGHSPETREMLGLVMEIDKIGDQF